MNIKLSVVYILVCWFSLTSIAHSETGFKTEKEKLSYAMGIYFSQSVIPQRDELDVNAFLQAIDDALNGTELKMSQQEIQTALTNYQQKLANKRNEMAGENKINGEKFLEENKKKEDVVQLDSGLQYKILKQGSGDKPTKDSSVKVHYHGTLISGEVFDSSYERGEPVTLSLNQVIKGWQEAVPMMSVGSKWQIYVPAEMAYGERGAGGSIGPNETLIFDIELLEINN